MVSEGDILGCTGVPPMCEHSVPKLSGETWLAHDQVAASPCHAFIVTRMEVMKW